MKSIITLALLLSFQSFAQAQFLKGLGKKVEKAVERTIERKAEQKAEETTSAAIDSVLEASDKKKKPKSGSDYSSPDETGIDLSGMMEAMKTEAKYETKYTFDIRVDMNITDYKKGKVKDEDQMTYYMGDNIWAVTMQSQLKEFLIFDNQNESTLTLDLNKKSGTAMSTAFMKSMGQMVVEQVDEPSDFEMTKTGRTKVINGYSCEEYVVLSDQIRSEAWITQEAEISYQEFFKTMSGMFGNSADVFNRSMSHLDGMNGFVIKSASYEDGELVSEMLVTRIVQKPNHFDLSGFDIQNAMGRSN